MSQTVESRVLAAIAKIKNIRPDELQLSQLIEDVCNNSLDKIDLMIELEIIFAISIPVITIELNTIQDLVDEIKKLIPQRTEKTHMDKDFLYDDGHS